MNEEENGRAMPAALALLSSERPRNVGWVQAAALLFGDWGTSRLYVLGLAFLVAGTSSIWLMAAMSLLTLAVGWAYIQICRLYPDGGGVYTAGKRRSRLLGVIGALLLFADYTVTASLSAVEAFHYFGLGHHEQHVEQVIKPAGDEIRIPEAEKSGEKEPLWDWRSPGLWAILAILVIGAFNLMGPKHTAGYAIFAAVGMVAITLLIVIFAVPQIPWRNVEWGRINHPPGSLWHGFIYLILTLSGVEAISNLTGVMKKPVYHTASRSIWTVALEVALLNVLLAVVMISLAGQMSRDSHTEDMLAFMAGSYIGLWGEWTVRILGGLLLLSATNTAVNGLMSIMYVMSRDNELPGIFQKLNSWGAPWIAAFLAALVPAVVLFFAHDLQTLASLYAIGVVGAVALNCGLAAVHPRLRKTWRKGAMVFLAIFLFAAWITLATTKIPALIFVTIVMATGLILRQVTKFAARRRAKPSLLRLAIMEQLTPQAFARPKIMLATAGSDDLAESACAIAEKEGDTLVVCFVREVALNYKVEAEQRLTLDSDPAAQQLFSDFLEHGHRHGVPIIPHYDTGPNGPELIAEAAAMNGVHKIIIGSSRRGALHNLIKGSFQRKLEALLPSDIRITVMELPQRRQAPREEEAA